MYLRWLELEGVRLFDRPGRLSFEREGRWRQFTVVLAENGNGKTTLLQAIALAASGEVGANKLAQDASAYVDRRRPAAVASLGGPETAATQLRASFEIPAADGLRVSTAAKGEPTLEALIYCSTRSRQFNYSESANFAHGQMGEGSELDYARSRDLSDWFVVGYGTSRALPSPAASSGLGNRSIDRLESLFRPVPLVATAFVDLLSRQLGPDAARDYARTLREVLVGTASQPGLLPREGPLRVSDLELRGQGEVRHSRDLTEVERVVFAYGADKEVKIPAFWLSAGFQSTIAWIADLLGQAALDVGKVLEPAELKGLVLIDELDLHVHPRWQATLVPALRRLFPRLQFVASTHSPMLLPGLRPGEVLRLQPDAEGSLRAEFPEEDPRLLTASQLYREYFGIEQLFPSKVGDKLRRYGLLAGVKARSDAEETEVWTLHRELRAEGVEVEDPEPRDAHVAVETNDPR